MKKVLKDTFSIICFELCYCLVIIRKKFVFSWYQNNIIMWSLVKWQYAFECWRFCHCEQFSNFLIFAVYVLNGQICIVQWWRRPNASYAQYRITVVTKDLTTFVLQYFTFLSDTINMFILNSFKQTLYFTFDKYKGNRVTIRYLNRFRKYCEIIIIFFCYIYDPISFQITYLSLKVVNTNPVPGFPFAKESSSMCWKTRENQITNYPT